MRILGVFLLAIALPGQSPVELPRLGWTLQGGTLRALYGTPGAFLTGEPIQPDVLSAACSGSFCLWKTDRSVESSTGERFESPTGRGLFGMDASEAWIYFPSSATFAHYQHGSLTVLDWRIDGDVLAVSKEEIAVRRGNGVWIVHPEGAITGSLPDTARSVVIMPNAIVYARAEQIVYRARDLSEHRFPLEDVIALRQMGRDLVQIDTPSGSYALFRGELYMLPRPAAISESRRRPR